MSTATGNPITLARERNLAERALSLFVHSRGLEWSDSYRAAGFEAEYSSEKLHQALLLVAREGMDFATAALITTDPELNSYQRAWDAWQSSLAHPSDILTLEQVRELGIAIFDEVA